MVEKISTLVSIQGADTEVAEEAVQLAIEATDWQPRWLVFKANIDATNTVCVISGNNTMCYIAHKDSVIIS